MKQNKQKRIGISFWGINADFRDHQFITLDTPDGHRFGRPILIKELSIRGHDVILLQENRIPQWDTLLTTIAGRYPKLDILFIEYRWPTWKNDKTHPDHIPSKFEPDLERQEKLLEHYHGKIPIIVWDTDLKITKEFELKWPEVIIADPSLYPKTLIRPRISIPFWTDFKELLPAVESYPLLGYVGNNYERSDEFKKFYFNSAPYVRSLGIQTSMYGNWLQTSPEREHPSILIDRNQHVAFNHRMGFYDSMCMMNKFICTIHVSKPHYYETGFLSPRYFEALAVNCPALVPESFKLNEVLGKKWIVSSSTDVISKLQILKNLSAQQRKEIVDEQRECLKSLNIFDVKSAVNMIERCCRKPDV